MWQQRQLKQTIISTGAVGAFFGVLFAIASVGFYSEQGRAIAGGYGPVPWTTYAGHAAVAFVISIVGCIVLFGLLPMALQYAFAWLVRLWTGRA